MQVIKSNGVVASTSPGKILMLGSYLVLFPNYSGVVLATRPSIETTIKASTTPGIINIFAKNLQTNYHFSTMSMKLQRLKNPYLEFAIKTSLETVNILKPVGQLRDFSATMEITGHPSFYKQGKTGLGSSSAVVSSVVGSIMNYSGVSDLGTIHLVSQVAHSLAQNFVGSGCDIACNVLGSQVYKRYDSGLFSKVFMEEGLRAETLHSLLEAKDWSSFKPYSLPSKYSMNLHHTGSGTTTVSLVTRVMSWANSNPEEAKSLFDDMKVVEEGILQALETEDKLHLKHLFHELLHLKAKMGTYSKTEIIPDMVKRTILSILQMDEDTMAGVPGAGGFDAFYTITRKGASANFPGVELVEENVV